MRVSLSVWRRMLPAVLVLAAAARVAAQTPVVFHVQGRLNQANGAPVPDGTQSIRFTLWDRKSGGEQLWTSLLNVPVHNGVFDATLGEQDALPVYSPDDLGSLTWAWLEIRVGGDLPMSPRLSLTPVPTALRAASLDDGAVSSSAKIAPGVIGTEQIANNAVTADKIAPGVITNDKLAAGFTAVGPAGGDLTGTYPNPQLQTMPSLLAKVSGGFLAVGAGSATVDQSQTVHNGQAYVPKWQSFTVGRTGFLTGLDIYAGSRDSSSHTANLTLYAGEGIAGTHLDSRGITIGKNAGFQHFDFTQPVYVHAGDKLTWGIDGYSNIFVGYNGGPGNDYTGGHDESGTVDYSFNTYVSGGSIGVGGAPTPTARVYVADPGAGTNGILVGSPTNVAAGSNAKVLIAEDSGTPQWPFEIDRSGTILYAVRQDGTVFSASSRALKQNVKPFADGLETAMKLKPVTFDWKPAYGGAHDLGLVAEDTASVLSDLTVKSPDGKRALGVRYDRVGVVAIQAIQEQQNIIARQQADIAALRSSLAALQSRLSALEQERAGNSAPR